MSTPPKPWPTAGSRARPWSRSNRGGRCCSARLSGWSGPTWTGSPRPDARIWSCGSASPVAGWLGWSRHDGTGRGRGRQWDTGAARRVPTQPGPATAMRGDRLRRAARHPARLRRSGRRGAGHGVDPRGGRADVARAYRAGGARRPGPGDRMGRPRGRRMAGRRRQPRPCRSNLATALTDRYERDGEPGDLDRALTLFAEALKDMRASGDRLDVILHSYGCCFHEHATAPGGGVADFDRAIALFEEALRQPDPDAEERAGYLNSLGLAVRRKGLALADSTVLAQSSQAYVEARRGAARGGETWLAASINLAGVLYDRAEADNEVDLLRQAVDIYREVLALLAPADERRQVLFTTNLATALIDLYRYSRDRSLLDQASRDLRANAERLPDGPVGHTVLANLAAAMHEMFDYTGRLALLDEAIAVQELLVGSPDTAK